MKNRKDHIMVKEPKLRLVSAVFCNSASQGEGGKVDCRGVFTSFLAWGYPTSLRAWHAILTLYDLPPGTTSISIAIAVERGRKKTLASVGIEKAKVDLGSVINVPLQFQFPREGFYLVHFNVIGRTTSLRVPVKVTTKQWPTFSQKELDFLSKNPRIPHSVRVNLICSECSRPYVFEESVLPNEELVESVFPFPDRDVFKCLSCGRRMHLKDIQGQVRSSIKTAVEALLSGGQ
jgi:DNA-directed RNA polymerase subunit RPC12/RpoP